MTEPCNQTTKACPTMGAGCRGCPDCQGIPFDAETDAALRADLLKEAEQKWVLPLWRWVDRMEFDQ